MFQIKRSSVAVSLVLFAILGCSGQKPQEPLTDQVPEIPIWLNEIINEVEAWQVADPPLWIARYQYRGDIDYFRPAYFGIASDLYDSAGELMCHPDGGDSGDGDNRCPGFFSERTDEVIVWRDQRAPPSIEIVSTSDCSECSLTVPEGETRVVYITMTTDGLPSSITSINSAQFKVFGLPEGWSADTQLIPDNATPIADTHADPFGPNGAVVYFQPRAPAGQRCVVLYAVTLRSGTRADNVELSIRSNGGGNPPLYTYEDQYCPIPVTTHAFVHGGSLHVNSDSKCP